jgi:uncharacterized membrane protein
MDNSIYIARLLGPVLVILGLSFLFDYPDFNHIVREIIDSSTLTFILCALGLLGGVALILAHNVWVKDWRLIITVLGWWTAFESAVCLIVPHVALQRIFLPLLGSTLVLVSGVLQLLTGGILSYFGYLAPRQATGPSGRPQ